MLRSRRLVGAIAVATAVVLTAAACGDGGTTTVGADDVEFGEGTIPSAIPDDFPVPNGAVIGSYLVDRINRRSEVELRVPSEVEVVAQFYNLGLVNAGYVVEESASDGRRWTIAFRRDQLQGEVALSLADAGITQAVIEVNDA